MNTYVNSKEEIQLSYSSLPNGITKAGEICPACKGGSSKEGSLSVTSRDGVLLFRCHRASCSFSGAVGASGNAGRGGGSQPKQRAPYPRVKTEALNLATIKFLSTRYGISREVLESSELGWTGDHDGYLGRRVAFPISGPNLEERGKSYRSFIKGAEPKAVIELKSSDEIKAGWYKRTRKSPTLVLVEDPVSALRLSPHTHVVSLFGTHISEGLLDEIRDAKYEVVFLSLDKDAVGDAIRQQVRIKKMGIPSLVMSIDDDVKDMSTSDFTDYVSRVATTR